MTSYHHLARVRSASSIERGLAIVFYPIFYAVQRVRLAVRKRRMYSLIKEIRSLRKISDVQRLLGQPALQLPGQTTMSQDAYDQICGILKLQCSEIDDARSFVDFLADPSSESSSESSGVIEAVNEARRTGELITADASWVYYSHGCIFVLSEANQEIESIAACVEPTSHDFAVGIESYKAFDLMPWMVHPAGSREPVYYEHF